MKSLPRQIEKIIEPEPVTEGAGVRLKRSIATQTLDYLDPFLLLDHFASSNPRDYEAGFPLHPHRGIETVTYVLRGEVHHKDTLGNSGSIGAGDVQWMTAGRGIMHEDMRQVRRDGVDGTKIVHPRLVVLGDGDYVKVVTGVTPVRFLLVSGKPLHEPIARYGPFVMNTEEEIEQTLRELREGTFVTT